MSNLPPTLPQSLINLIGEYGFARVEGASEIERIHRWELLIDGIKLYAGSHAEEAVRLERERLDAIERIGPNGTIRIDDERGLAPRYIHWGGSTGLTLRDAIDTAIRARSQEGQG